MTENAIDRSLTRQDAKTLALASLGGALEFYDFIIYVFFAVTISNLFFPADMPKWLGDLQTYGIFAAGYLARPLGGIIMAHFGDQTGQFLQIAVERLEGVFRSHGATPQPNRPVM